LARKFSRRLGRKLIEKFDAEGNVVILGRSYPTYQHPVNGPVFDLVRRRPDRFLGWAFVRPGSAVDPTAEMERWAGTRGFVGVKAHPYWHRYEPLQLLPVALKLVPLGKPLLIHAGFGPHGNFLPLLDKAPGLKLIIAHAGFPGYSETLRQIKPYKNVTVDLSQTSYVGEAATRRAVEALGCERCLYGTDGPYGFRDAHGAFDYGFLKSRLERLFPDPGVRRRLMGDNFAELAVIS
jgi:predicted TIM-barrel fold metal-dependent hydrolase